MATKAVADSSVVPAEVVAMQLTQDITQGCWQAGEIREISQQLHEETPFQEICDKTIYLAWRVYELVGQAAKWELSLKSEPISSVNKLALQILSAQFEAFNQQFQELTDKVSYNMNYVLYQSTEESQKLLPVFEKTVGQYLQTRNYEDAVAASKCSNSLIKLGRSVRELTQVRERLNGKEVEYAYDADPVQKRMDKLSDLIGGGYYNDSMASIFIELDQVVAGKDGSSLVCEYGVNKDRINPFIEELHKQIGSDQVNYWVWQLSGQKSGKNWGEVHRYDDLGILKEAILLTAKSLADKIMKEDAADLEPNAVYAKLFQMIGEPRVENPMAWMKENACYYHDELRRAINEVKFPRRSFELLDDFDDMFSPSGYMNFDQEVELPRDRFKLFDDYDDRFFPVQNTNFDELVSQLERFDFKLEEHEFTKIFAELQDVRAIQPELRDRIERMIADLSQRGLEDILNYEVWRLGGQQAGDNWGVAHRYDNPAVLREALMIATRRDVHNMIVEQFPDEEDLNAFYAQITQIALGKEDIPSNIDPVAYGKENIVFHLHRIEGASHAVKEQIERRREEKARESDAAMKQLIEGIIANNPAAQGLGDLIESIEDATSFLASEEDVKECKDKIKAKVEGRDFDEGIRNQIFLGIWRANGEPAGDANYGRNHYLDDLEVLAEVLLNIIVEIGVNGE